MDWSKVKLSDILHRKRESIIIVPDEEYKLVTIKLHHKGLILRETKKGAHIKSKMSRVRSGDFLLSGIDARNGAFGIVPNELDDAIITNDFWCLVPNEKIIIKEFLLFLTSTPYFDYICNQSSDGTTQRIRLQKDKFFNYEITIPPLGKQEQILKMLSGKRALCDGINAENYRQLDLLIKLRQQILQDAVQGKLVPQDPNDESAYKLLERIKAEKAHLIRENKIKKGKPLPEIKPEEIPYEIPEDWVWCRLGELASIVRGGSPRPAGDKRFYDGQIPFLKVADLTADENIYLKNHTYSIKEAGLHKTRYVDANTLMLTNSGATLGVPKICIFPTTFNDGIAAFLGLNNMDMEFMYYFLKSKTGWYLKEASRGQGQPNLNTDIISLTPFALPPLSEQNRLVTKIEQLMSLCDELEQSIQQNQKYSHELLQVALKEALEPKTN